jgi:hypothetical protein
MRWATCSIPNLTCLSKTLKKKLQKLRIKSLQESISTYRKNLIAMIASKMLRASSEIMRDL